MTDKAAGTPLRFRKMHGAGNDFVVLDGRGGGMPAPDPALVRALGDRHRGIGFDQMVMLGDAEAGLRLWFWNPDGSASGACGNGTRCAAALVLAETGADRLTIAVGERRLEAVRQGGAIWVNMGQPAADWRGVPLAGPHDLDRLPIPGEAGAVGMGNPHVVFPVEDADAIELTRFGPAMERHALFPDGANVELVEIQAPDRLRVRVWERGTGITLACGSGACAAAVVMARRGRTGRRVTIAMDGGDLAVDWREDGVWLTGPVAHVFDGIWAGDSPGAAP